MAVVRTNDAMARYGALLDAVRGLAWPSQRAATGVLPGTHVSRRRGAAPELSEYRAYRQGDDPRCLDWKLLGRTDRAFVRLAEERAILPTVLVVDASASMAYPPSTLAKWQLAMATAVGLAAVAHASGDPVGLTVIGERDVFLPPRTRSGVVGAIAETLGSVVPAGSSPLTRALVRIAPGTRVALVSDFLGDIDPALQAASALAAAGSDIHAVHVVAREELELSEEAALFVDPERDELRRPYDGVRGGDQWRAYQETFGAWRADLTRRWRSGGATITMIVADEDPARAVRRIVHDARPTV